MENKRRFRELIEAKKKEALEQIRSFGKDLKKGDEKRVQDFIEKCLTEGNIHTVYIIGGAAEYLRLGKKKKMYKDLDFLVVADKETANKINREFMLYLRSPMMKRPEGIYATKKISAMAIPVGIINQARIRADIKKNPKAMLDVYFSLAEQGVPLFNKQTGKNLQKVIRHAVEGQLGMQEYDTRRSKWRKKLREKRKKAKGRQFRG